jgi:hypothetical protein
MAQTFQGLSPFSALTIHFINNARLSHRILEVDSVGMHCTPTKATLLFVALELLES